jgi:hypothetical protein
MSFSRLVAGEKHISDAEVIQPVFGAHVYEQVLVANIEKKGRRHSYD